uniref:Exostosin GT47 domain-containing protein n=1 Tax=Acrobeloides nanus TaxID=290746 RepID=A0A914EEY7_9BILA
MNGTKKTLYVTFYFNVIPVDQGGNIMEYDWIVNVLLEKINRPIKIVKADEKHRRNDTLHVYLFQPEKDIFVKSNGLVNQGAYHMGDELMKNNIDYYPIATYVFRNYYNADYLMAYPSVHYVPLGTKTGFGPVQLNSLLPPSQRKYMVNFIGSIRSNRQEMVDRIKNKNITSYIYVQKGWASSDGLNVVNYRDILRESVFTLAPWGNNPESMRLYEAIEAGSIPIFQKLDPKRSPMTPMGPNNPIPQFDNWNEAIDFIDKMSLDVKLIDNLQKRVISFWKSYKEESQLKIKKVIDKAFRESHGYEC